MRKVLLLCLSLQLISLVALAQGRIITGTVTDEDGKPVPNVTVSVTGSQTAVQTKQDGTYSIPVRAAREAELQFSSSGFIEQTVKVNGNEQNILLAKNIITSDDVVVIGYQTVKRKELTGSVSSVGAKQLKDIPINSAAEALNGRLAGVTATSAEGAPDAEVNVRVRGGISITGDNSPLYIVDGVQVDNALSTLSPQDIQSIDVLKDASATAIYGSRGANGVVIITTKSGRRGRTTVTYNGFIGVKQLPKTLDVLSPYDFVIYQSERSRGSSSDSTTFADQFGFTWDTLVNYKNVKPVDWQKEVLGRTGITQTHNLALSGGNKKIVYNFGYTFNNEKPIVINSKYTRNLLNFKADYTITKNLKAGIITRYMNQTVYGAGVSSNSGSSYSRLRNSVKYRPFLSANETLDTEDPYADPNVGNGLILVNPILLANSEYKKATTDAFNLTAYASYTILKNLSFKTTFGYNYNNVINRQFYDSLSPYAVIQDGRLPMINLDSTKTTTFINSNVLTYSLQKINNKHDISIILGEETVDIKTTHGIGMVGKYPVFTTPETAFSQQELGTPFVGYPSLNKARATYLSFFTRVNYGFMDKYLLSLNVRADGTSKFAPGNQWGYFPGGSFAWKIKNENFMKNARFIDDLKLRLGYGAIGNSRIADYLYITTFNQDGKYYYSVNNQNTNASYSPALVNPNLKWEALVNKNIGLDISLVKRIDLSIDYYINNSRDLLLSVPIDLTYGYSAQLQNIGKTQNKGVEIQLAAAIITKKDFSWNANFNISSNKNKILALGQGQDYFYPSPSWGVSGQPTDYIEKVGAPVGAMYGLVNDGFYKVSDFNYDASTSVYTLKPGVVSDAGIIGVVQPGSVKFRDLNNDGVVDLNNDRTIIGNPTPKFTGGLNQQFRYKNWDASIFVNFSYGNDIYNANKIEFTNGYTGNSNMLAIMSGRWKVVTADGQTAQWTDGTTVYGIPPDQLAALNANATIWQPIRGGGAFYPSTWAIEDGSFLRLNNITIGYSFSKEAIRNIKMKSLRLYLTANNLAVFTRYSGYDPEVSVRSSGLTPGLDYSAYPKSRMFIFGINATF
ncbi:hypothetical protein A8C56_23430 [Niabella ginsenosidivorans]|uniref:TonB-dependent receptor plug domain-containing protein n=1 Tax=Niabella ginsenosidivorans TaxID=1176587 RepID=A0A1A9IAF0_9BACT|nr:TonB-dependent receptor [Niabella ginsenosidivorans]ANH83534.1 hypothetical protein A8C56_23430 [Niabella ginsenosidivorans]